MNFKKIAKENADIISFLKEYNNLCKKYKMGIKGCGCCGSPYLSYGGENNTQEIDDVNYDDEKNVVYITENLKTITIDEIIKKLEE